MIERERRDGLEILRMAHGKASALDAEFLEALAETFEEAAGDGSRGAVLTGTGGIFSAGVDLFRVLDGGAAYIARFLPLLDRAFGAVYRFPKPLVAAINGHAIAGGCVLTACCDYRLMARGAGTIGAPELQVGVPFPTLALEIMRDALPAGRFRSAVLAGTIVPADRAVAHGFVDELVEPDRLMARALEVAAGMAAPPARSFRITKQDTRRAAAERVRAAGDRDAEIAAIWRDPATHETIRAYVERTIKK